MREEVELLEDHPDLAPDRGDVPDVICQLDAIDDDLSALVLLEPIDRPDERRLAGSGCAEDHHDLAGLDGQVDAAQHVERSEPLVDITADDDVRVVARSSACVRSRCIHGLALLRAHRFPTPRAASSR